MGTEFAMDDASLRDRAAGLAGQVFFVVGAPRSGTTLVQAMLSSHPRLAIPPEGEFFMKCRPSDREADAAASVERYLLTDAFGEQSLDRRSVRARGAALQDGTADGVRRGAFLAMLTLHAERLGADRVGEKSPHHCRHVDDIRRLLPAARFIHVLRDPRDVVASRLQVPWTRASHLSLARSWVKDHARHRRHLESLPPAVYTEVRLERLIADPEGELRRLCGFLGESFDPTMLRFHERADPGFAAREQGWKGGTMRPLDRGAAGRYRTRLTARQIAGVERVAGSAMRSLGYPLDAPGGVWSRAGWRLLDLGERLRDRARSGVASVRKRAVRPGD